MNLSSSRSPDRERYEHLRLKHLEEMMGCVPEHLDRTQWSREQIDGERERTLRQLLSVAKSRSPWHRQRLAGIDPERATEADLLDIPPMTKVELMEHWDEIVTDDRLNLKKVNSHMDALEEDAYLLDEFHAVSTGGTSGLRGVFVYDRRAWLLSYLGIIRWQLGNPRLRGAKRAKPRAVSIIAASATHSSFALNETFNLGKPDRLPATMPVNELVAQLNQIQPEVITGYPSVIELLVDRARQGALRISPRTINCLAEPLYPDARKLFEDQWGAYVTNNYGAAEALCLGVSCGHGSHLHVADDLLIVEPVDDSGRPVPPGERSAKIYLTNLFNHTLPLIRYELTDRVLISPDLCACGSHHRVIQDITGRLDDLFVYEGGARVMPVTLRGLLGDERHLIQFQVSQTQNGLHVFGLFGPGADLPELKRILVLHLEGAGLQNPEVQILSVEELPRTSVGKLKNFVPLPNSSLSDAA